MGSLRAGAAPPRHPRLGEPVPADEGGVIELRSRDGKETAVIAALPWVQQRKVREFETLMLEGKHHRAVRRGRGEMIAHLCASFRRDTVNMLLAHVFVPEPASGRESASARCT